LAATMRGLDLRGCDCAAVPRTRCEQFECAPLIGGRGHQ